MSNHVVLLGDSVFDNAAYTRGEPDVVTHLRAVLPAPWSATLCAVDGATTADVARQLSRVPGDATNVVLSVGGNDALLNADLLDTRVRSTAEALALFAGRVGRFEQSYGRALEGVAALGRETAVCTIYNGNLPPEQSRLARVALMIFNDAILRAAFKCRLSVIDLRSVCASAEDYANPIEPSGAGGLKIARAIARSLGARGEQDRVARVFVG
jgi:GDSL-like Lipase/Acylhydrolase family